MQTAHLGSSPGLSYDNQNAVEHFGSPRKRKKRLRNKTESPEPLRPLGKKGVSTQSKTLKNEASDLEFACPFYKHDPTTYGGKKGCANWSNHNIQTVIRVSLFVESSIINCYGRNLLTPWQHHVLGTHRQRNKKLGHIDDAVFDRVRALKASGLKAKTHGWDEQKRAEELWKAVYATLFLGDADEDEAPDPCTVHPKRLSSDCKPG
jgi:hypothetical protein